MNAQQTRRLCNVVFLALALVVLLAGFRRASEWVDDTIGDHLRARNHKEMLRIEQEIYNRILATEGLAAATKYKRTPKFAIHTGVLSFYEDHQGVIVFTALTILLVLAYFVVWFGLTRVYGYVRYGRKGERGAPPNVGLATPHGDSRVTKGPPSVS